MNRLALISPFVLFSFISCVCFGQQNFVEGYVLTSTRDTLSGFISDKATEQRVADIRFKKNLTDTQVIRYTPAEVSGFYLQNTNEFFLSQSVDIDKKPVRLGELEPDGNQRIFKETVFLKLLVKGKANLFFYQDENGKSHYFIQKDNADIKELGLVKYSVKSGDFGTLALYKEQLKKLLGDCPQSKPEGIDFTDSALKKAIQKYNQCMDASVSYTEKKEKLKFAFGFIAGVGAAKGKFNTDDTYSREITTASGISYTRPVGAIGGISCELIRKSAASRLTVCFDLLYKQQSFSGNAAGTGRFDKYEVSLNLSYLQLDYMVKYAFPGQVRPYLKLGVLTNKTIKNQNTLVLQYAGSVSPDPMNTITQFGNFSAGFTGAAGISFQKLSAELRYEFNSLSSSSQKISFNTTTAYLLIGYRFK